MKDISKSATMVEENELYKENEKANKVSQKCFNAIGFLCCWRGNPRKQIISNNEKIEI